MNTQNPENHNQPVHPLRRRMVEDMTMRKLNHHSQQDYLRQVKRFSEFLGRSPDKADAEDIRRYQLHLENQQVAATTINAMLSGLSFFFKVTLNRPDAMRLTRRPRLPVKIPDVLSPEEVYQLIQATRQPKYKAIFTTTYGAGLRVSEVAALKVSDIDSERMILRVEQGKGSRDRQVMLSKTMLEALRQWWRIANQQNLMLPGGWLFPGRDPIHHVSTRQIERVYHEVASSIGLKKKGAMHSLRHAFATHLLEDGVDIRVIQELLGHRRLNSTARYCHIAKTVFNKTANPLDTLVQRIRS